MGNSLPIACICLGAAVLATGFAPAWHNGFTEFVLIAAGVSIAGAGFWFRQEAHRH